MFVLVNKKNIYGRLKERVEWLVWNCFSSYVRCEDNLKVKCFLEFIWYGERKCSGVNTVYFVLFAVKTVKLLYKLLLICITLDRKSRKSGIFVIFCVPAITHPL